MELGTINKHTFQFLMDKAVHWELLIQVRNEFPDAKFAPRNY